MEIVSGVTPAVRQMEISAVYHTEYRDELFYS